MYLAALKTAILYQTYTISLPMQAQCTDGVSPSQQAIGPVALPPSRGTRCGREFYNQPCEELAKALLGCVLVRVSEGEECRGVMVETEAYLGSKDKAAHSRGGHRTERNEAMYMQPGTAYVYSVYGVHNCFNISSNGAGCAVLVRALGPVEGLDGMRRRRGVRRKDHELCNGPAKLCQAMGIGRECDKLDLVSGYGLWVEQGGGAVEVVSRPRIGIDYAEEWVDKPLRFYIKGNKFISKK